MKPLLLGLGFLGPALSAQAAFIDNDVTGDARFPGAPAWGPEDITSAIAFLFDPNAIFASTIFTLGGAPEGTPPPPPEDDEPGTPAIPVPASLLLLGVGLLGLGILRRDAR